MTQPFPSISVIVPVHRGGDAFRRCMDGIARSRRAAGEVIVVVDGEPGEALQTAERHGARILRNSTAHGPAHARNRGAEAASGDVLFFVDADVVVEPSSIARVAEQFAREPDLAALIGSYDDAPGAGNFLSQYRNLLHHYTHQAGRPEASTFWGACGAVRRGAFRDVGGFDERYRRPCIEDIELGYRLRQAGYAIRLVKDLQVKHLKRWEAGSMIKTDIFSRALPWTALLLERRQLPNDLNLDTASRLSTAAVFALAGALAGAPRRPALLGPAGGAALALLGLNKKMYTFFYQKRGLRFTLRVLPWHWLYYAYSGVAFGVGLLRHALGLRGIPAHLRRPAPPALARA